ncbi:hypothetical protein QQ73_11760, partial [Candidatus Endoriftia persephone str. Guaymas]|nr:hypothetical protein [Candidatus Endoriftia persephone str. Guaymas]
MQFSSEGSTDPDGRIVGYHWVFGDGNSSTEINPLHSYATAGNYTVTLTLTDDQDATGSASIMINVSGLSDTAAPEIPAGVSAIPSGADTIQL